MKSGRVIVLTLSLFVFQGKTAISVGKTFQIIRTKLKG